MLQQELTNYPKPKGYRVTGSQGMTPFDPLTVAWRRRICEWIFEIVDHFSFDRDVVSIALNYIDRSASLVCESSGKAISRNEFQLLSTSCLYLALKLHGESDTTEGFRLKIRISSFEALSSGAFTEEVIEATEQRLCSMLDWRLNQPTPSQFLGYFVRLLPVCSFGTGREEAFQDFAHQVYDIAKYHTELACFDLPLVIHVRPSSIAYAALLCALDNVLSKTDWSKGMHHAFLRNISRVDPSLTPFNETVVKLKAKLKKFSVDALGDAQPDDEPLQGVDFTYAIPQRVESDDEDDVISRQSPTGVFDEAVSALPERKRSRTEDSHTLKDEPPDRKQCIVN